MLERRAHRPQGRCRYLARHPRRRAAARRAVQSHGVDATFYFSVGPDHTGRAIRRVFRKGFAQKVARTSVLKHYGLEDPDVWRVAARSGYRPRRPARDMRSMHDAGFEVGLHTYDHVRWQDHVAQADEAWTRMEFERGLNAFERVFGFLPQSHAAAGWQINRMPSHSSGNTACNTRATRAAARRFIRCSRTARVRARRYRRPCRPSMN